MEIEEIKELQEKLDTMLHSYKSTEKFATNQLNLLEVQLMSMKTYFRVLRARIEDFQDQIIRLENKR